MIRLGQMDGQVLPDRTPAQIAALDAAVHRFAASLDAPTVITLDAAMHPDTPLEVGTNGRRR
jgi:hypothetical protein